MSIKEEIWGSTPKREVNFVGNRTKKEIKTSQQEFLGMVSEDPEVSGRWIVGCGTTVHIAQLKYENFLLNPVKIPTKLSTVSKVDDLVSSVHGSLRLRVGHNILVLQKVFLADVRHNLLSIKVLEKKGFKLVIERGVVVLSLGKDLLYSFQQDSLGLWSGMFPIENSKVKTTSVVKEKVLMLAGRELTQADLQAIVYHYILCHPNARYQNFLLNGTNTRERINSKLKTDLYCEPCLEEKLKRKPVLKESTRDHFIASAPNEKWHVDTVGPIKPQSVFHQIGFVLLTDAYSRYRYVLFYKKKSQAGGLIVNLLKRTTKTTGNQVKCIHTDEGTEINDAVLKSWVQCEGIVMEFSNPYLPEEN